MQRLPLPYSPALMHAWRSDSDDDGRHPPVEGSVFLLTAATYPADLRIVYGALGAARWQ
jgi:hypothetical protein